MYLKLVTCASKLFQHFRLRYEFDLDAANEGTINYIQEMTDIKTKATRTKDEKEKVEKEKGGCQSLNMHSKHTFLHIVGFFHNMYYIWKVLHKKFLCCVDLHLINLYTN